MKYKEPMGGLYNLNVEKEGDKFIVTVIENEQPNNRILKSMTEHFLENLIDPVLGVFGLVRMSKACHNGFYSVDPITGLYMYDGRQVGKNFLNSGKITVAYFDINDLKKINGSYGHNVGDAAIISFAEFLKHYFKRRDDRIFRAYKRGDEFIVVGPSSSLKEEYVKSLPRRIVVKIRNKGVERIISFGYSVGLNVGIDIREVVETAERECMKNKTKKEHVESKSLVYNI